MFEKEGIRYALEETIGTECLSKPIEDFHFIDLADEQQEKAQCWKDGAEFGYNKANEWHYVKDGDLPSDKHGHVVINQDWDKVTIRNGRFEHLDGGKADVIAWKEIVLPKEIENV